MVATRSDLDVARDVLRAEARGLAALADALDSSFAMAVGCLADLQGRAVVTGMGKSGHVARKIAATLASTGTPALFVHPAEASHGDLGMILAGDAILALSNSGETAELADLVEHARRFSIPLLAITANAGSALAQAADLVLLLPSAPEACPMGLAPTTSTTMQMALGDALAVALLRRVRDVMQSANLPLAEPASRMSEALIAMTAAGFGCLGAVSDGKLVGIITDGDLRRSMGPDLLGRDVAAIMTRNPLTIPPDALAADALRVMNQRAITLLFVVEDGRPLGVLHIHDLLGQGIA